MGGGVPHGTGCTMNMMLGITSKRSATPGMKSATTKIVQALDSRSIIIFEDT